MNDKVLALLEKYDIEVLRSWKGRGAILCETKDGIKILKEYKGSQDRLRMQKQMIEEIKEKGVYNIEQIMLTKEGEFIVKDEEMNTYCLKDYFVGKECNIKEVQDCYQTVEQMAKLHKAMILPKFVEENQIKPFSLVKEFEKRTRELKHVKKYLKSKHQKNEFEYFLYKNFDLFLQKAESIAEEIKQYAEIFTEDNILKKACICHGDFQHHNVVITDQNLYFINFEKNILDSHMRDLSLFFRKVMEKNNWKAEFGINILESYQKENELTLEDRVQLYYRLSYPEKFWKIVNYYFGSSKVWIPAKNMEKFQNIINQESEKNIFLNSYFKEQVLHK